MDTPATNVAINAEADGSVVIDLNVKRAAKVSRKDKHHDDNLVEILPDQALQTISQEIIEGVDADIASRTQWVDNYNQGLKLLGLLLEKGSLDSKTSKVRHPLLMWAIVKFQALARGEMLPTSGPVKVRNDGTMDNKIAQALEDDLNHFLTVTASEYYPDTDRALFYLGYGGTIFKKVYRDPLRNNRPVSEAVYLPDLIISNDATDMANAARLTHRVEISTQRIIRLQEAGFWADVTLMQPTPNKSSTAQATGTVTGIAATPQLPRDYPHTIYETYTGIDLTRWGEGEPGQRAGIEYPYRVSIDRDSRQVYEIRRNWRPNDETHTARRRFVKWGLVPGIGFLDLGYLNLLGNHTLALTALERILVDAGIYSIWPGGVRVKGMRMETNEIRPGPGEFPEIDTGSMPINNAIMPLPFKGPAAEVLALLQHLEDQGEKTAGQVELETGEGRTNVPVGTIMAAIEQQTQVMVAVHKRLHTAQGEELQLIRELLVEDESGMALLKQANQQQPYTADQLGSASLVPASDPNTPAFVHRIMQGTVLETLATNHPQIYNQREVQKSILEIAKFNEEIINRVILPVLPPTAPPPDPTITLANMQAEIEKMRMALDAKDAEGHLALDRFKALLDKQGKDADRQQKVDAAEADRKSREDIAAMNDQTQLILKGIEQLGQPTSAEPARDTAAGP